MKSSAHVSCAQAATRGHEYDRSRGDRVDADAAKLGPNHNIHACTIYYGFKHPAGDQMKVKCEFVLIAIFLFCLRTQRTIEFIRSQFNRLLLILIRWRRKLLLRSNTTDQCMHADAYRRRVGRMTFALIWMRTTVQVVHGGSIVAVDEVSYCLSRENMLWRSFEPEFSTGLDSD